MKNYDNFYRYCIVCDQLSDYGRPQCPKCWGISKKFCSFLTQKNCFENRDDLTDLFNETLNQIKKANIKDEQQKLCNDLIGLGYYEIQEYGHIQGTILLNKAYSEIKNIPLIESNNVNNPLRKSELTPASADINSSIKALQETSSDKSLQATLIKEKIKYFNNIRKELNENCHFISGKRYFNSWQWTASNFYNHLRIENKLFYTINGNLVEEIYDEEEIEDIRKLFFIPNGAANELVILWFNYMNSHGYFDSLDNITKNYDVSELIVLK